MPPHCPTCLGLTCHVPGCPEEWTDPEEETMPDPSSSFGLHTHGLPVNADAHTYEDKSLYGDGYLHLECCGGSCSSKVTIYGVSPESLRYLARQLDAAATCLAEEMVEQAEDTKPEDVPFGAEPVPAPPGRAFESP